MSLLRCGARTLDLSTTQVMGILNVTPDSFSDGGSLYQNAQLSLDFAVRKAAEMQQQGATIIDIGGESTRPGAEPVPLQQEMDRVLPVVEKLNAELDVVISVDTSSPELMAAAAKAGAGLLNDVRALERDGAVEAAAATGLPVCLMHMKGSPKTMQDSPEYGSVVEEVIKYLLARAQLCEAAGIDASQLILDPGFGFGKTLEHNLQMLEQTDKFVASGYPVLIGTSRKSMIGNVLNSDVDDRLAGSLATIAMAVERGAQIVRVHDVKPTVDVVKVVEAALKTRN